MSCQGKTNNDRSLNLTIDKDLSTGVSALGESYPEDIWIRFDLPKISFIDKIVMYTTFYNNFYNNPDGGCHKSEDHYEGCKRNQNGTEVSVYRGEVKQKSCGKLNTTYGREQSDQIYTFYCGGKGNAVMLEKTTSKEALKLPVWKIVIFGEFVPGLYLTVTKNQLLILIFSGIDKNFLTTYLGTCC